MDDATKFEQIDDISQFIEPIWLKVQSLIDKGIGKDGITGEIIQMRQCEGNYGKQVVMSLRCGDGQNAVDYWIGMSAASIRDLVSTLGTREVHREGIGRDVNVFAKTIGDGRARFSFRSPEDAANAKKTDEEAAPF